ncbi:LPXTG cell wall anchor domain-containing protein [Lactobacillus reuteri]|uniref:LPXTG cell wall anchor domain-containing protein n=1 Tax=Limosilactobacillus reuteri TaxID=1598 RepID=A0AB36AD69_LIMRT|nr:LPXTG cell wall anchor domain-containing protein [Limosilactobacillus reuteri]
MENNQVVDAKGNSVEGWTVKGNQIVSPTNATVDSAVSGTTNVNVDSKDQVQPQTSVITNGVKTVAAAESANPVSVATVQTREQYKQQLKSNNQLPQTGNDNNAILSLTGVALAAMLSLFGIKKREY